MSRVNPYTSLLRVAQQFAFDVKNRTVKSMFFYPAARLGDGWSLIDLKERVAAADQLGWDVLMKVREDGLHVEYHKRVQTPSALL